MRDLKKRDCTRIDLMFEIVYLLIFIERIFLTLLSINFSQHDWSRFNKHYAYHFPALMIAMEFSTGLISISLIVTPNRKKFFTTKILCYVLLSLLISLVTIILLFLSTQLILAANGVQLIELTDSAILQFMSGVFFMLIFYIIISVAATFLFNNSAGGITFTLGIMVLPSLVKMFPDSIQRLFSPIFPQSAIHSISGVFEQGSPESLGIIFSNVILFIWIAAIALVANVKFQEQDI